MAQAYQALDIRAAYPAAANIPSFVQTAGTNYPVPGWSFTITSSQAVYWDWVISSYASGNLNVSCLFYASGGQTTNNVRWDAQIAAITPGDAQSIETKAFATATNTTTTINGTARGLTQSIVVVSNLDSLANLDLVRLKLLCSSSSTLASNPILTSVTVDYLST